MTQGQQLIITPQQAFSAGERTATCDTAASRLRAIWTRERDLPQFANGPDAWRDPKMSYFGALIHDGDGNGRSLAFPAHHDGYVLMALELATSTTTTTTTTRTLWRWRRVVAEKAAPPCGPLRRSDPKMPKRRYVLETGEVVEDQDVVVGAERAGVRMTVINGTKYIGGEYCEDWEGSEDDEGSSGGASARPSVTFVGEE